ncbi:DUF2023 family protein [Limisalsivibrio acetivorans]|uniref:DUF2023 family protein n=1 Tax=Limisalsivibrio acetivorans TaxID=1304888 RepID=UPI0003B3C8A5|nr:DUF2023 family protein [Limisalsivibrio acetivorans]
MQVFCHHLYEYKKGLRSLILHTAQSVHKKAMVSKLEKNGIDYLIQDIDTKRFNIFFGEPNCVEVVRRFDATLDKLTNEQDFILGIMLGYDRILQCRRYLQRTESSEQMAG